MSIKEIVTSLGTTLFVFILPILIIGIIWYILSPEGFWQTLVMLIITIFGYFTVAGICGDIAEEFGWW